MRRLVLILLMFLLPFQWSWAAAASVCEHEQDKAHFGHHEHKHSGADKAHQGSDASGEGTVGYHLDCHACNGIGVACLASFAVNTQGWPGDRPLPGYGWSLPEPPIENLLRPPLKLVA